MWETWVRSLDGEDHLEKEMATHSSTLAWKIPQMEEPHRLQSMGSQRVAHDWATSLSYLLSLLDNNDLYSRFWICFVYKSCIWEKIQFSSVAQSCPTLCDPMDGSLLGSSVHGISQVRILEWVAISFSRWSSPPGTEPVAPALAGKFFTIWATT